ncbi:MAG TPA: GatB/YqeY domain-containing protein [Longimicrobiales bacterium]|nr:GatB/YqeY domain-containing protein [Longimicrobiales bacterium]
MKKRLREDLNEARRARDKLHTQLLTTILADLRYREIELGRDANDADVIEVVNRGIKRRREAAEQMRSGNRTDLANKEETEAGLLAVYLPKQLAESEVRNYVRAAIADGATSMGAVMGKIMPRIKGVFDGKEANRIVREELEQR